MCMLIMSGKTAGGNKKEMYSTHGYYVVIFYHTSSDNSVFVYPKNDQGSTDAMEMYKCCD